MTDAPPQDVSRPTRTQWLMLLGVLAIAIAVRSIYIGWGESHYDDLWHLELTAVRGHDLPVNQLHSQIPRPTSLAGAAPWYSIPAGLENDVHPPFYYLLLRGWRELFGESIFACRIFSAVMSVLAVLLLFDSVRLLHGVSVALWASLILALSSAQIEFAQCVQSIALLIFLTLGCIDAVLRVERYGLTPLRGIALVGFLLAAAFTHYFFFPAAIAMLIYALWRLRSRDRIFVVGAVAGSYLLFLAIWGPMIFRQAHVLDEIALGEVDVNQVDNHLAMTFVRLAAMPVRQLFEPRPLTSVAAMLSATLFVLPWLLLRSQPKLLLWTLLLVCVGIFAAAVDLFGQLRVLAEVGQILVAGPAVCAILAALLAGQKRLLAHGVPALVALCCIGALGLSYERTYSRFSGLSVLLRGARGSAEPIVFYSDRSEAWWSQWMFVGASQYSDAFPHDVARLDQLPDAGLLQIFQSRGGVWLVTGKTNLRPDQILPGALIIWSGEQPYVGRVWHVRWPGSLSERS